MSTRGMRVWLCVGTAGSLLLLASPGIPAQDPPGESGKSSTAGTTGRDEPSRRSSAGSATADDMLKAADKGKSEPEFVRKSNAEWRRVLTRAQYSVTREKATEPAFSGRYASGHFRGTFLCVCCKAPLFSSAHKFESGTGWPSFYRAINERALQSAADYSEAEPRMEVMCRRCGAHLGHVFNDGPPPTGMRFCINSISLVLQPPDAESAKSAAKTAAQSKAKTSAKSKTKPSSGTTARARKAQNAPPRSDADSPATSTQTKAKAASGSSDD